jgi:glutamate synthase domain-containing protein 2
LWDEKSIIIQIASLRWGIFGCYGDDRTGMNLKIRQDATGR